MAKIQNFKMSFENLSFENFTPMWYHVNENEKKKSLKNKNKILKNKTKKMVWRYGG